MGRIADRGRIGNPEIDLKSAVARGPHLIGPGNNLGPCHQERATGAQATCIGNGNGQSRGTGACHGSQENRNAKTKSVTKCGCTIANAHGAALWFLLLRLPRNIKATIFLRSRMSASRRRFYWVDCLPLADCRHSTAQTRPPPRSQGGAAGVRELAEVEADSYRWAMARVPTSSASAPYQRASSTIAPSRTWPLMAAGASSKPPAMSAVARIP